MLLNSCADSVDLLPKPDVHGGSLGLKTQQARSYSSDSPSLDSRASSENQDLPTIPASHEATYSRSTIESASAGATNKTGSKRNVAGNITLSETQPEQPKNESFKWKLWRRDLALLCLGLCCFVASGMSTVLAAGFSNVAQTYDIGIPKVSLSTGFYMLGLGIGDIFATPTAILYGKRPVYVGGVILLVISAIWCSLSPNYPSLVIARTFQGKATYTLEIVSLNSYRYRSFTIRGLTVHGRRRDQLPL